MSLYDKDSEVSRLEFELEHAESWVSYYTQLPGADPKTLNYWLAKAINLKEEIAAFSGNSNKHSGPRCECGANAAGFSTHMHYCPLANTANNGGESR